MKNRLLSFIMILTMTAFLAAACSFNGSKPEEQESTADAQSDISTEEIVDEDIPGDVVDPTGDPNLAERESNGISYDQELEGSEIERVRTEPSQFVGKWTITSDRAIYMYGNLDLVVNSNGSWAAKVTDEKLGGTWKDEGDHIHLDDTSSLDFDMDLAFDKSGALILTEPHENGDINTVLSKAE